MNKKHELKALKEQREQLDKQIERVELELKEKNKWADGHWFIHPATFPSFVMMQPELSEVEMGVIFTTKANCQSFIEYQKAMVKLRDACRPYRTDDPVQAYIPCLNDGDRQDFHFDLSAVSKMFWVNGTEKAIQIAQAHIDDLKIIQNFKWEE
jgi:hypothetical protein